MKQVFSDFFEFLDPLSQISIMDFIIKLSENEQCLQVMTEANFIQRLFETYGKPGEDSYGFITSNMLLVGAKLYSMDTELFNVFENENYTSMLKSYLCNPIDQSKPHVKDIGIQCLFFIFKQKNHCLLKYLLQNKENHCIVETLLHVSRISNNEYHQSYLQALVSLFTLEEKVEGAPDLTDSLKLIFSNLSSPEKFPNQFGSMSNSVNLLIKFLNSPEERDQLLVLELIQQLMKYKWAC